MKNKFRYYSEALKKLWDATPPRASVGGPWRPVVYFSRCAFYYGNAGGVALSNADILDLLETATIGDIVS